MCASGDGCVTASVLLLRVGAAPRLKTINVTGVAKKIGPSSASFSHGAWSVILCLGIGRVEAAATPPPPTASPAAVPAPASAHTRPLSVEATSKYCDGQLCLLPKECCPQGCCVATPRPPPAPPPGVGLTSWNNWYLWLMLLLALASCAGGCGLYRRRRHPAACCGAPAHLGRAGSCASERSGSPASCCAPPHYSRCASLHLAPPPYTEVAAKPDLYPLVFGCGPAPGKAPPGAAAAGSYLMVQYFRNYIVRPIGSLSGASTVDSLSSGFLCSAANEANSMVPPPYSCTGSLDEFGLSTATCGAGCDSSCGAACGAACAGAPAGAGAGACSGQRFVSAAALSAATGSDASSLADAASPPRATSPTLELRSLLGRVSRAYLPLPPSQPPPPPRRWLSRSAPATPCAALLPPLPSTASPAAAAAAAEGCSPLLAGDADDEDAETDARLQQPL